MVDKKRALERMINYIELFTVFFFSKNIEYCDIPPLQCTAKIPDCFQIEIWHIHTHTKVKSVC